MHHRNCFVREPDTKTSACEHKKIKPLCTLGPPWGPHAGVLLHPLSIYHPSIINPAYISIFLTYDFKILDPERIQSKNNVHNLISSLSSAISAIPGVDSNIKLEFISITSYWNRVIWVAVILIGFTAVGCYALNRR
jgi:hypothetical protein